MNPNQKDRWKKIKYAGRILTGLLYPPRCVVCDRVLPFPALFDSAVCPECLSGLSWITEPVCMKCGRPVRSDRQEYCDDCRKYPHSFDRGISVLPYDDTMRRSIGRMKRGNRKIYLEEYAAWMADRAAGYLAVWKPDCVVPVPMHWKKKRIRGFNPSEVLAGRISELTGIPCRKKLVKKYRATQEQKQLNRRQRQHNLEGAFCLNGRPEHVKKVLLIDDVYTTGSTVDEVSRVLKRGGVREVFVLTLSIGG